MSHTFFAKELEGVATFWRIYRRDGVTLGFTTHDRPLRFDGVRHSPAPGMLPSSIRKSSGFTDDPADVQGLLSHDSITADDLASGRFDDARVHIGAVDWETLENAVLYRGTIGSIRQDGAAFTAELRSAKALFDIDPIPRTSPSCRARFCGPGCGLSPTRFTSLSAITGFSHDTNAIFVADGTASDRLFGEVRFLDGPMTGLRARIRAATGEGLILDAPLHEELRAGTRVELRQGCDHRLETCANRFGNAVNFQGEPFLPGNDLLAQYPTPS